MGCSHGVRVGIHQGTPQVYTDLGVSPVLATLWSTYHTHQQLSTLLPDLLHSSYSFPVVHISFASFPIHLQVIPTPDFLPRPTYCNDRRNDIDFHITFLRKPMVSSKASQHRLHPLIHINCPAHDPLSLTKITTTTTTRHHRDHRPQHHLTSPLSSPVPRASLASRDALHDLQHLLRPLLPGCVSLRVASSLWPHSPPHHVCLTSS